MTRALTPLGLDIGKESEPYIVEPFEVPTEPPTVAPVEEPDRETVPA